jgi:hypothetical protein
VRDRNGVPDGCICSALDSDRNLFIVSALPDEGLSVLDIVLMITLGVVVLVALALYRRGAKSRAIG